MAGETGPSFDYPVGVAPAGRAAHVADGAPLPRWVSGGWRRERHILAPTDSEPTAPVRVTGQHQRRGPTAPLTSDWSAHVNLSMLSVISTVVVSTSTAWTHTPSDATTSSPQSPDTVPGSMTYTVPGCDEP